jgi:hypothetical protein
MTIPHITIEQAKAAVGIGQAEGWLQSLNRLIDSANAQQESEYITAEQARELGAGNAEWRSGGYSDWQICGEDFQYFSLGVKYRAIKQAQSKPIDPHAAIRAEYAKQVEEGTTGFYLWELKNSTDKWVAIGYPSWSSDCIYHCTDISCYVSKDGEPAIRMLTEEAASLLKNVGSSKLTITRN